MPPRRERGTRRPHAWLGAPLSRSHPHAAPAPQPRRCTWRRWHCKRRPSCWRANAASSSATCHSSSPFLRATRFGAPLAPPSMPAALTAGGGAIAGARALGKRVMATGSVCVPSTGGWLHCVSPPARRPVRAGVLHPPRRGNGVRRGMTPERRSGGVAEAHDGGCQAAAGGRGGRARAVPHHHPPVGTCQRAPAAQQFLRSQRRQPLSGRVRPRRPHGGARGIGRIPGLARDCITACTCASEAASRHASRRAHMASALARIHVGGVPLGSRLCTMMTKKRGRQVGTDPRRGPPSTRPCNGTRDRVPQTTVRVE